MTQTIYPPNTSYLYQSDSGTLDQNGNALLSFTPDTGQFWLPTIVHVSSDGQALPCELHSGGLPNFTSFSTFKDFTPLGNNDTSTILSGSVLARGESIVVKFSNGLPGAQVFAQVYGLSSVIPPTRGIVPDIPGARFAGASFNPPSPHQRLINVPNFTVTNGGPTGILTTPVIAVDAFEYLSVFFQSNTPGTAGMRLELDWFYDGAASSLATLDVIDILGGDTFNQSISVKTAYVQAKVTGFTGTSTFSSLVIGGATSAFLGQRVVNDSLLISANGFNLGAGLTNTLDAPRVWPGPAVLTMASTATTTWNSVLSGVRADGSPNPIARADNLNPLNCAPVFLPPSHYRVVFTNTGAVTVFGYVFLVAKPLYP